MQYAQNGDISDTNRKDGEWVAKKKKTLKIHKHANWKKEEENTNT
jgi:hypothetical protein